MNQSSVRVSPVYSAISSCSPSAEVRTVTQASVISAIERRADSTSPGSTPVSQNLDLVVPAAQVDELTVFEPDAVAGAVPVPRTDRGRRPPLRDEAAGRHELPLGGNHHGGPRPPRAEQTEHRRAERQLEGRRQAAAGTRPVGRSLTVRERQPVPEPPGHTLGRPRRA